MMKLNAHFLRLFTMKKIACTISLTVLAACLIGCGHKLPKLSPEMRGLSLTKAEAHNNFVVSAVQNGRSVSDDLARTFLTDSPSRLSPYPVVSTGGMPR